MTNSRWERIKEVFNAALAVAPGDRPELLRRLAGDDAELRREVESLLDARTVSIVRTGGAAHALADLSTSSIPDPHAADRVGMLILRYKLLQLIGEGGFGTVYLAEQTEPVRRKVALKVIKPGMDSRAIVARFEAERQALAMMDHPHIARVLDGGVTPLTDSGGGLPFFVMEYVVGDPITRFADAHALSITDRLELFQQVCSAVQHAHTKGIIHRDLKPANVLVSMVDGKPFVKVIDFGIAKATGASGGRLTDKTFFTEHRQLIGTPEYMSPEQAEGSLDIDTRTDVYALGVLLYELLTGTTPIEAARLRSAAYDEMRRMIREDEPLAPSLKLSRSLETLARTAAARKVEPGRLSGIVKGELDWIVMRALEKERGRRYETPSALADDVRRHLSGEPVVAAPVSRAYRVRKFVRKNKGPVLAVSAVMLALVAGGSVAAWQANAAQRAAMREREAALAAQVQQRNAEAARDALAKQIKSIRNVFDSVSAEVRQAAQAGVFPAAEPKVERPPAGTDPTLAQLQTMREYSTQWIRQAVASHRALQEKAEEADWSAYTANLALAQQSLHANDSTEARRILQRVPQAKVGWEHRRLTLDAERLVVFGHRSVWLPPVFSDDGALVLSGFTDRADGSDSKVGLWDARSGRNVWTSDSLPDQPLHAELVPGAQKVVIFGSDANGMNSAVLDRSSGELSEPSPLTLTVAAAWFPPDAGLIALTAPWSRAAIWDTRAGKVRDASPRIDARSDRQAPYAPLTPAGGRLVVYRTSDLIDVVDAATGRVVRSFAAKKDDPRFIAVSPGGARLALMTPNGTHIVETDSGRSITVLPTISWHDRSCFSRDGEYLLVGSSVEGQAQVFDIRTGAARPDLAGKVAPDRPGFFSPDGSRTTSTVVDDSTRRFIPIVEDLTRLGGATTDLWMNGADLAIAFITAGQPIKQGLTLTTPDRARVIRGSADGTVRFYAPADRKAAHPENRDAADDSLREVAVFRMPDAVTNLQMTGDGTRLIIHFESGSARVWDIRDPEERRKDLQAEWAERVPAGAYLDTLWAGSTPDDKLRDAVTNDASLTPLRRLVAVEMLEERLENDRLAAEQAFAAITQGQTEIVAVRAAAAAADLPARVKARVMQQAEGWKPDAGALASFAWEIVKDPKAERERAAAALNAARKAMELRPEDEGLMTLLGAALYRAERFQEALNTLERLAELRSGWRLAEMAFAAMSKFRLGRVADAGKDLASLRELASTDAMKGNDEAQRLLAEAEALIEPREPKQ